MLQRTEEKEERKVAFIVTQRNDRRTVSEGIIEPPDNDWQDMSIGWLVGGFV